MTQRKPAGMTFNSWIDAQLNNARNKGDFDHLPGKGQKIPGLDEAHDELWWVKSKLRQEGLSGAPRTIATRKKAEDFLDSFLALPSEWTLRQKAEKLNAEILEANRGDLGPLLPQKRLDVDDLCRQWRAQRE